MMPPPPPSCHSPDHKQRGDPEETPDPPVTCDTLDDVREIIETEEFFNQIPMCEEFSYFVARDWIGRPISKFELNSIERQRRIFEKRAFKKRQQYETRKKKMEKHKPKIQIKDAITTLTF